MMQQEQEKEQEQEQEQGDGACDAPISSRRPVAQTGRVDRVAMIEKA